MTNDGDRTLVRAVESRDRFPIAEIYNHYVATSPITFEEEPVPPPEIARRIAEVRSACLPWLIAEESRRLIGYSYASHWRPRSAYRFSVEITAYVAPDRIGRGVGSKLYRQLIPMLRASQVHAVLAAIALPNDASVTLHERFGFAKVAHFHQVGFKFGPWIDVGYWQLTF